MLKRNIDIHKILALFYKFVKHFSGMFLSYLLYQIPKTKIKNVMPLITRVNLTSSKSAGKK